MRWPAPDPDAPYVVHLALRFLLPLALGAALGLGLEALFGVWALAIILPGAMVYCVRELRWIKRMKAEIAADQARFAELARHR
jgi:hypothetical protein